MEHVIINPTKLPFFMKDNADPITLINTFYGEEYTDSTAYLKFNNAIQRMSESREVDHTEVDVEFVVRNEDGSVYAVVYHKKDGVPHPDMLVRKKNGEWSFYSYQCRFLPKFVSAYISSIYGYKRVSESQIATELAQIPATSSDMGGFTDKALAVFPGGVMVIKYATNSDEKKPKAIKAIDFIPYEAFDRDKFKVFYLNMLHQYVDNEDLSIDEFPEELIEEVFANEK